MKIRRMKKEDIVALTILRHELWPEHKMEELLEGAHQHFLEDEDYPAFLAVDEYGEAFGFLELSIHTEAPGCKTNQIAYIEGLYVKEGYRHQGAGRQLVNAAEEWARSKGITEMASDTNEKYPKSPAVHKALGYKETDKPFHYKKQL